MEPLYHQFGPSDGPEGRVTLQTGVKRPVVYALYGALVLLLLVLLTVTGVKFSLLNKDIADIKHHLHRISHGGQTSSGQTSSAEDAEHAVYLEKLVPVRGTCSEGWASFQRSCYLMSRAAVTWREAEQQCQSHGGQLLVLNDVEELDYISKTVEIQYDYWIGLVERQHEGHWSWVDGTDFKSTPTYWDEGQPDDWDYRESGEDCGQIHSSEKRKRKRWNDADCKLSYRYICERRA